MKLKNKELFKYEIRKLENKTEYYYKGKLHREDGPAVEYADGSKLWYQNGQYHRLDGPACEFVNGAKAWYQNGQLHREDGPAVEYTDGDKAWYIEGKKYTEKEYNNKMQELSKTEVKKFDNRTEYYYEGKLHRRWSSN